MYKISVDKDGDTAIAFLLYNLGLKEFIKWFKINKKSLKQDYQNDN